MARHNNNRGLTENIYYDSDNRFSTSTLNGTQNLSVSIAPNGNIIKRSDVANNNAWSYDPVHVHEVTQAGSAAYAYAYDANGNVTSRHGSSISWSSYNYPTTINDTATGESVSFLYGPDRRAYFEQTQSPSGTETNYHVGGLLDVVTSGGVTDYRHYIYAGSELVAIDSRMSTGVNALHYILSDHQGSVAAITDKTGALVVGESFTAYGNRRNPSTWSGAPTTSDLTTIAGITRQGYTLQDALGQMGLNDMVGRVQDAITGRFLSADQTLPDPSDPQSYNRYSYTINNPMTYTDPSGFIYAVDCWSDWGCGLGPDTSTPFPDDGNGGNSSSGGTGGGGSSTGGGGNSGSNNSPTAQSDSASGQPPQSVTGGSELGAFLRSNVGLVGGILGDIGDILSGLGNIAGGIATFGQFGDISTGLSELGGGVAGLVQIGMTDLTAGLVGAAGYVYNLSANAINVLSLGNLRSHGSLLSAAGSLVANAMIPDYGLFGGPRWGVDTIGANPQYALNSVDYYSEQHDVAFGNNTVNANYNWVQGNWAPTPSGMVSPGPLGIAYVLLGTLPFGLSNPFLGQGH